MFFFLSTNDETHITTLTLTSASASSSSTTTNKILLQSLSPFVKGLTIHQHHQQYQQYQQYQDQNIKAKFHATSVMRFTEFKQENKITMKTIERLIEDLTNQIYHLSKKYRHTFYRINPNNIIVIDFSQFLYISSDDLMPLTSESESETDEIIFTVPFCKDYYISPEIKEIMRLPSRINAKTIYYSLGSFIIDLLYTLFSIKERKSLKTTTTTPTTTPTTTIPPQIKYTKLYWFLHKATLSNPKDRHLLFI